MRDDPRERIREAVERAEAATEGPWTFSGVRRTAPGDLGPMQSIDGGGESIALVFVGGSAKAPVGQCLSDGKFIAHARQDVPDLAEIATAALDRADRLAWALEQIRDDSDGTYTYTDCRDIARVALLPSLYGDEG